MPPRPAPAWLDVLTRAQLEEALGVDEHPVGQLVGAEVGADLRVRLGQLLLGRLREGATATDLVLRVTEMLRAFVRRSASCFCAADASSGTRS